MTREHFTRIDTALPPLLLHICCGPCAAHVVELLTRKYQVTGFFYNPNIYPEEEYIKRLEAAREVARRSMIPLIEGDYTPNVFFSAVQGLEHEPENGRRCVECFRLRLVKTMETAFNYSFTVTASTLTTGPMKKASGINPIGRALAEQAGITFLEGDWKKNDGFKHSCERSREYGIYRQKYCGCLFSMREP